MTDTAETAAAAQIKRMPDGRVGVLDQYGKLVGMHNSHQSALRQLGDYYGQPHAGTNPEMQAQAQPQGGMAPAPTTGPVGAEMTAMHQAQQPAVQIGTAAHTPTPQDMKAGMDFGASLIHQHPFANPHQLVAFAHQMGQEHGQNALGQVAGGMAPPAGQMGGIQAPAMQPGGGMAAKQGQAQNALKAKTQAAPAVAGGLGPQTQRMI